MAESGPYLVVLGLGTHSLGYLEYARENDIDVIGFDKNPSAPGRYFCSRSYSTRIDDHAAVLKELLDFTSNVVGVIAEQSDYGTVTRGHINSHFGLTGLSREQAESVSDKAIQRQKLSEVGLTQPRSFLCENLSEANKALEELEKLDCQVVVKPRRGQGSSGVTMNPKSRKQFIKAWRNATAISKEGVLVEELVFGRDFSLEGFVSSGRVFLLAIGEKLKSPLNPALDEHLMFRPSFECQEFRFLIDLAESTVASIGLDNSLFHIEYRGVGSRAVVIEWSPRGCGSGVATDLLSNLTGLDTIQLKMSLTSSLLDRVSPAVKKAPDNNLVGMLSFSPEFSISKTFGTSASELNFVRETFLSEATSARRKLRSASDRVKSTMVVGSASDVLPVWSALKFENLRNQEGFL